MESFIHQLHAHIRAKRLVNMKVRYANMMDLLLILRLLRSGKFEGTVAEEITQRDGFFKLFFHFARLCYMQWVGRTGKTECLAVISSGKCDIGLLQVACSGNRVGAQNYAIKTVGVLQNYNRNHFAIMILDSMVELLTNGSTLQAYCNHESQELMQLLRNLPFVSDDIRSPGLTVFTYQKQAGA